MHGYDYEEFEIETYGHIHMHIHKPAESSPRLGNWGYILVKLTLYNQNRKQKHSNNIVLHDYTANTEKNTLNRHIHMEVHIMSVIIERLVRVHCPGSEVRLGRCYIAEQGMKKRK